MTTFTVTCGRCDGPVEASPSFRNGIGCPRCDVRTLLLTIPVHDEPAVPPVWQIASGRSSERPTDTPVRGAVDAESHGKAGRP